MFRKLYNKIFSPKKSKLAQIIDRFAKDIELKNPAINENFLNTVTSLVLEELEKGASEVYIITGNKPAKNNTFEVISSGIHEGKKTLWIISTEKALLEAYADYSEEDASYFKMTGSGLLQFAEENNFQKIIIDRVLPIGKLPEGFSILTIPKDTNITIGLPANPIPDVLLQKLIESLKKLPQIVEAYHYLQHDTDYRLMLAVVSNQNLGFDEKQKIYESIGDILKGTGINISLNLFDTNSDQYQYLCQLDEARLFKRD